METEAQTNTDAFNLNALITARKELRNEAEAAFTKVKDTKKFDRKDLVKLMNKLMELVSSLDNLSDIVINDLMIVDNRFKEVEQRIFAVGQSHAVLRQALEDKNIVSKQDMTDTWNNKVKPEFEAKLKQAQEAMNSSNIIQPESPGLVDASGMPITT